MSGESRSETESATLAPQPIVWADRDPEEGARRLALGFLEQAVTARERIADPDDAEGLHDFRVALRRLRSTLGTYDDLLARSVGRKSAKKLKALAGATGEGRDSEVALAWIEATVADSPLAPAARLGHRWLRDRLIAARDRAYEEIGERIEEELEPLARRLRERLSFYRTEVRLDAGATPQRLGDLASAALVLLAGRLDEELGEVASAADEEDAHRARITAKRLRYLLEPFAGECPPARAAIKRLKGLQEILGELHDSHVLERLLMEETAEAGAERARRWFELSLSAAAPKELAMARRRPLESGLVELGRRNRARRDALFGRLAAGWIGEGAAEARGLAGLLRELERTTAALGSPAGPQSG